MKKGTTINLKGSAARGFMFAMYQERIDKLEAENAALRRLVDAHDNYLCSVDKTCTVTPKLLLLEEARAKLAALEAGKNPQSGEVL